MNETRFVLVEVYSTEEYAMPEPTTSRGSNDPRARLNIAGLREIAKADVVLAVAPSGAAVVVKNGNETRPEAAFVTTIHARPEGMA